MSLSVDFDNDDVAAEAGVDPWQLYDDFREELDPDAIWEAAKTYESAASEAGTVTEFAELATQENVEAADYGGTSLSNAESRLESTMDDIDNAALEATVGSLHRVVAAAGDAQTDNYDEIYGAEALQTKVNDHKADARNELDGWFDQLTEAIEAYNARLIRLSNAPMIYPPAGAEAAGFAWGGGVFADMDGRTANLPPKVAEDIRQHYLEKAAEDAKDSHGRIEDNIEGYRSVATNEAAELDGYGYDLGNSQLDIWYTPGMAEYHAQEIQRSLEVLEEDPDDIDALTNVRDTLLIMGTVTGDLYDDNFDVNRQLEDGELAYLDTFFDTLSSDDLALLGNLEPSGGDSVLEEPWTTMANGINALSDPAVGGREPTRENLPDSVSEYLFGYPDHVAEHQINDATENMQLEQREVDRFGGFSNIMSHASIPPGDEMARLQFGAATDMQLYVDDRNEDRTSVNGRYHQETLLNPNGGGLLDAVALNLDTSQEILTDPENRENLMTARWEDSNPAGKVLTSALVPEDGKNLSPDQIEIADHFIKYNSENPDNFVPEWDEDYDPDLDQHPSYDATGLHTAVGNAGIMRMDDVLGWEDSPNAYTEDERQAFFTLMAAGDESVYQSFKADVFTLQQDHAQEVFTGQGVNDISQVELEYVAMLTDSLGHGERAVLSEYGEREDARAEQEQKFRRAAAGAAIIGGSGVTTVAGIGTTGVTLGAWTAITGGMSGGIAGNSLVQSMLPDYEAKLPDTLDNYQASEAFMNEQMAYMAILNGAAAANGVDGIDTSDVDFEELYDGSSNSHGNIPAPEQGRVPNSQARDLETELGFEYSVRNHASGAGYGEEDNRN